MLSLFRKMFAPETKDESNLETEYDDFPYPIGILRQKSEQSLYKKCVKEIIKAQTAGQMHCYLLSGSTCPLPRWIKEKLLAYGLDLSEHSYKADSDYWCEAFWDSKANGKMREYQPLF